MKLRSKGRKKKLMETQIYDPEEEHLVTKALYASLQSSKRKKEDECFYLNDSSSMRDISVSTVPKSQNIISETDGFFEKMRFAARKTATVITPGTNVVTSRSGSPYKLNSSFSNTNESPKKKHNGAPSTEMFLEFLIRRGTPFMVPELDYIEDVNWEMIDKNNSEPIEPKAKKSSAIFSRKRKREIVKLNTPCKNVAKKVKETVEKKNLTSNKSKNSLR